MHGIFIGGIACQVKSAQPLQRQDLSRFQQFTRLCQRIVRLDTSAVLTDEPHPWPAHRTGVRLGMKPPIERIIVLGLTVGAHDKLIHRRLRPVVGDVLNDRKSRPAVGAVGERVIVAAIAGREDLPLAVFAGGDIGRDKLILVLHALALVDHKLVVSSKRMEACLQLVDPRPWGCLLAQGSDELAEGGFIAFGLDLHTPRGVAHPAGKLIVMCQSVDERSEPDSLHDPLDIDPCSLVHSLF